MHGVCYVREEDVGMLTCLVIDAAVAAVALVDGAALLAGAAGVVVGAAGFADDGDGAVLLLPDAKVRARGGGERNEGRRDVRCK